MGPDIVDFTTGAHNNLLRSYFKLANYGGDKNKGILYR